LNNNQPLCRFKRKISWIAAFRQIVCGGFFVRSIANWSPKKQIGIDLLYCKSTEIEGTFFLSMTMGRWSRKMGAVKLSRLSACTIYLDLSSLEVPSLKVYIVCTPLVAHVILPIKGGLIVVRFCVLL
jgi:hypothetical protein